MRFRSALVLSLAVAAVALAAAVSPAAVTTSQSGWTWGSPRPQGHSLVALDFAGGRGFAVGQFGTIVRTDDGGTTWTGVRSGLTSGLDQLRVIDANTFVAGGGCTLLRSDDGGQSIRRLRFTSTASCEAPLRAVAFSGPQVGYLLLANGSVLRTDDGGQRFSKKTDVPIVAGAPSPPNDIWFTDANTGVALTGTDVAGRIYRTTDGGGTWTQVAANRALRSVVFVSSSVGYAVGDNVVLKTTDGGATWSEQPAPHASLVRVRCADEMHCVVVANDRVVLYTDDGFGTLQVSSGPGSGKTPANAAAFSSATRAIAVGEGGVTSTSDDAGKTFGARSATLPGTYDHLRAVSVQVAFAPGNAGQLAKTTDAGQTWSNVGVPSGSNDVRDVAFATDRLGYAVDGQGSLFGTDNGGDSWAILGQPGFRNVEALWTSPSGGTVLELGAGGITRSTDGGQHFAAVAGKAAKRPFFDVDRAGANVVAYGSKAISISATGGQSWKSIRLPGRKRRLVQVDFITAKAGYALTTDGRVWRTTSGGKRWSELVALGNSHVYALSFGDARSGWVATRDFAGADGGKGWLLHTSDGGTSWRPQLLDDQGVNIGGLAGTSSTTAFALTGRFFSTGSGGDAGRPSTLTLKAKKGKKHRVTVSGKLGPSIAGAPVRLSYRSTKSGSWKHKALTTNGNGGFTLTLKLKRATYFVAQWAGNAAFNSAGSTAKRVR